jgi:putative transposase
MMTACQQRRFAARQDQPGNLFTGTRSMQAQLSDEMRRLNALEAENNRLTKIVADLALDREMLQDVIRQKL